MTVASDDTGDGGYAVGQRQREPGRRTVPRRHVLQVITDTDRRGGQVFATDLHDALERRGLEVRTVALAPGVSSARLDHDVLGPSRRDLRTMRRLRAEMAASSVVIGHGSTTLPMCAIGGVGLGVPFVYRQISQQLFWADTPMRRRRTALALRGADHVTVLWRGAAEVVTSHFGVPAERISIVPNGVPPLRCPPVEPEARRAARSRMGLDPDRPVLLSIGALVPEKGVDTLVRAMADPALDGWQLLVVGAGPELDRLTRLAAELPEGAVCMRAPVASGAEVIAAADVVGLTSRGGDSMPAVLIEAGMMGIPAVATPIEGIVDIVLDGRTGCIVAVDDAAATARAVAEVGSRGKEFGMAARTHCLEHFGIDRVAEQWHAVLDMLIAR
jgi:glycosyltransferase involved in cell wall biosynthesis